MVISLATVFAALAYLLPNHAPPWMSFLQEVVAAAAFITLAAPVMLGERGTVAWRLPEWLLLGLVAMPPMQALLGLIPFLQTAWMQSLYLLGLLVSMLAGGALERRSPHQVLWVLLTSTWLAALASVGLQLYQWLVLQPGEGTLWVYRAVGARPAANLGQPNLLATLLIFGLLGTYWLWRSAKIGARMAFVVAVYLLIGLALTQSRTGLLNALIVAASLAVWHWRRSERSLWLPMAGLVAMLCATFVGYAVLGAELGMISDAGLSSERATAGVRPLAWRIFIDGMWQRPLTGYGWGQSFQAQLAGSFGHPALHRVFLSAHNLPLDLALWCGVPVALAVVVLLLSWLFQAMRRLDDEASLVLWLFVVVLFVHALLEFPFSYAYFLLPAGLAAGALNQRIASRVICQVPAAGATALLVIAVAAFGITVHDYLRVEQSYRDLLFEKARIQSDARGSPPEVLVLTSLRELIVYSRREPSVGMSESDLSWMQDIVKTHPGPISFEKLARALALNGHPLEAQRWVDALCNTFTAAQCSALAVNWLAAAKSQPALRAIRWP